MGVEDQSKMMARWRVFVDFVGFPTLDRNPKLEIQPSASCRSWSDFERTC